jgi:threonine aldolase
MLEGGTWLRNAAHANRLARVLADELEKIPGLRLMSPCQANAVFVEMPAAAVAALRTAGWHFYSFIGTGGARFMCSWQTSEEDVSALTDAVRRAVCYGSKKA